MIWLSEGLVDAKKDIKRSDTTYLNGENTTLKFKRTEFFFCDLRTHSTNLLIFIHFTAVKTFLKTQEQAIDINRNRFT